MSPIAEPPAANTEAYDADGERLTRTAGGVTTVFLAGIWEEEVQTGLTRSAYTLQSKVVAQRTSSPSTVVYLHNDHLGSVSSVTKRLAWLRLRCRARCKVPLVPHVRWHRHRN